MKQAAVKISDTIVKKLDLKNGDFVNAKIGKGKIIIFKREIKGSGFMKFAGIWENDNAAKVFLDIRKGWNKWTKNLYV